jgi:hypothetical protein
MPKIKTLDDTITPASKAVSRPRGPATGSVVVPIWQQIDEALQARAKTIFEQFLEFAKLVEQAYEQQVWTHFGFQDPEPYFVARIGVMPRTFRRYRKIQRWVATLPPDQRDAAMEELAALGSHKAELVAAACEKEPERLEDWVAAAESQTLEALKEKVNQKLGLPPRGAATDGGEPGERFMRLILNTVPADQRDFVEKVFLAIQRQAEVRNPMAAFLVLVELGAQDLAAQGHPVE